MVQQLLTEASSSELGNMKCKNDWEDQVIVHLIDLHKRMEVNEYFEKLRVVMTHSETSRGFSMNFNLVHSLEFEEYTTSQPDSSHTLLTNPFDVKISYSCQCILVSHKDSKLIQLFDSLSHRFLISINLPSIPRYMHIESDFDGSGNDALLFTSNDNSVYKYDLKCLIENNDSPKFLWRNLDVKYPNGIVSRKFVDIINEKRVERRYIFVCDGSSNCIRVLKTSNGQSVTSIGIHDRISMTSPWGIDFTNSGDMVVTESLSHRIQILNRQLIKIDNSNQYQEMWKSCRIFGGKGSENGRMEYPSSVAFDTVHKRILVCDYSNHRLQIFSENGNHIKTYGSKGKGRNEFTFPYALCLSDRTGELLIVDSTNKRILTFV